VRWSHQTLPARDRDLEYNNAAIRVLPGDQEAQGERSETEGLLTWRSTACEVICVSFRNLRLGSNSRDANVDVTSCIDVPPDVRSVTSSVSAVSNSYGY
jgi:hypothetical protein